MVDGTDQQLLRRFSRGDRAAFDEFYGRHARGLFFYLHGVLSDADAAADVLQDLFHDMCRDAERFAGAENLQAYLFQACRNLAMAFQRGQARSRRRQEQWHAHRLLRRVDSSGPEEIERAEALSRMLQKLPLEQREVVLLRVYQELEFSVIAEVTGVARDTLYKRFHAALSALREHIR